MNKSCLPFHPVLNLQSFNAAEVVCIACDDDEILLKSSCGDKHIHVTNLQALFLQLKQLQIYGKNLKQTNSEEPARKPVVNEEASLCCIAPNKCAEEIVVIQTPSRYGEFASLTVLPLGSSMFSIQTSAIIHRERLTADNEKLLSVL